MNNKAIRLLFFGDFVMKSDKGINLSDSLNSLLQASDFRCCNFESPVMNSGNKVTKSGSIIDQCLNAPEFLEANRFNVVQFANNHLFDFGKVGFDATTSAFNKVTCLGAGKYEEAYKIYKLNLKNKRIGFLALTHYEFGTLGTNVHNDEYGTAWINHPKINSIIQEEKKQLDYLIILPHAGIELIDAPLPEWRARYKEFIDLGADAVIGSHPHIPQGWEIYMGKPVFYSLGNFYFDAVNNDHPYWKKGIAVELILSETITFNIHNLIFNTGQISLDNSEERVNHNQYLYDLLNNDEQYRAYINEKAIEHWGKYAIKIKKSLNAITFEKNIKSIAKSVLNAYQDIQDIPFLLNIFQCESHSWFIKRALNLKIKEGKNEQI